MTHISNFTSFDYRHCFDDIQIAWKYIWDMLSILQSKYDMPKNVASGFGLSSIFALCEFWCSYNTSYIVGCIFSVHLIWLQQQFNSLLFFVFDTKLKCVFNLISLFFLGIKSWFLEKCKMFFSKYKINVLFLIRMSHVSIGQSKFDAVSTSFWQKLFWDV